jgi:Zn-finger nucleic acid-binding protein
MKCPVCSETELKMAERQGIEIDYCPQCRGVWLDRGELDKIIERSAAAETQAVARVEGGRRGARDEGRYDDRYDDDSYKGKRHRKRGLLGELFDFD